MAKAGIEYQNKIAGVFKKYSLRCESLDKGKKDKMPDYYVYIKDNEKQGFICEIKSIISGGTLENGEYLISTKDPEFIKSIRLNPDDNFSNLKLYDFNNTEKVLQRKLKEKLDEAVQQYDGLIKNKPEYKCYPFVVAICEDFYAEILNSCDFSKIFNNRKKISAVIRLEKNYEKEQVCKKHLKELNEYYKNRNKNPSAEEPGKNWEKDYEGIPNTVRFRIWLNSKTKIKFKPKDFFRNPIMCY